MEAVTVEASASGQDDKTTLHKEPVRPQVKQERQPFRMVCFERSSCVGVSDTAEFGGGPVPWTTGFCN